MIKPDDINKIADMLTDDPDIFSEAKKKMDEVEADDKFKKIGETHEQQDEPKDPGKETHSTSEGPEGETGSKKDPYLK